MSLQATAKPGGAAWSGDSLRGRFLGVFLVIFLLGAAASYSVIAWFSQDLVRTLGGWFAEKSVLYEKSKVLQLLLREIVLTQKMAETPALQAWIRAERDPAALAAAVEELEGFRRFFHSGSYFLAIAGSGNYYFNDGRRGFDAPSPLYRLDRSIAKDTWFYETLRTVRNYQLNVNTDRHLQETKVWINTVVRVGGEPGAIVGTGVDLSDFIQSVVSSQQPGVTNMLLDRSGAIQAHHDVSIIDFASIARRARNEAQSTIFNLIDDLPGREAFQRAMAELSAGNGDTRSLQVSIQGKRHIAGITYLAGIKWFLVTLTHPDSAQRAYYAGTVVTVLIAALALTLLVAGLVFDRIVLRRLSALDAAARQIALGRYAVNLPPQGADELGRLGQAFRDMAGRIAAHTTDLEKQVDERTRALERLAYADFLTGLLNRRGMIDRIAVERNRLARHDGKLGVLILDLDHFKSINDNYGHDFGDQALVQTAGTIRQVMRSYDICARWGGEEFLIVAPDVANEASLATTAEKLRAAIATTPVVVGGQGVTLTASIGCYLAGHRESVDEMVKAADDALYAAKEAGRNRVVMAGGGSAGGDAGPRPQG